MSIANLDEHYKIYNDSYIGALIKHYKKKFRDIYNYGKSSILVGIIGYIIAVIFYDILGLKVYYGWFISLPLTWTLKYIIYNWLWINKRGK